MPRRSACEDTFVRLAFAFGTARVLPTSAYRRTWTHRSPNCRKLAAVTADRVVHLFDENGEKKDKFSTKPGEADGLKVWQGG